MIEIHMTARRHDHIMILFGSINSSLLTAPAHHYGIRRQSAFQYLIPTDHGLSLAVDIFFHALHKIALQLMLIFQTKISLSLLAFGTNLPTVFRTFISPDMNIFAGKKRDHFIQHIL